VTFEEIHFPRTVNGIANRNIRVTWTLSDGFGFCPQPTFGDGVFLKIPDSQFTPRGFGNPSGSARCNRKSVTVVAANLQPNQRHPYSIQFHSSDGRQPARSIRS
jgi:hypothetical protein